MHCSTELNNLFPIPHPSDHFSFIIKSSSLMWHASDATELYTEMARSDENHTGPKNIMWRVCPHSPAYRQPRYPLPEGYGPIILTCPSPRAEGWTEKLTKHWNASDPKVLGDGFVNTNIKHLVFFNTLKPCCYIQFDYSVVDELKINTLEIFHWFVVCRATDIRVYATWQLSVCFMSVAFNIFYMLLHIRLLLYLFHNI